MFTPLKLRPGVNVEATYALNESGISDCRLIRFKSGLPQKLGGWQRFYSLNTPTVPRKILGWKGFDETPRLAIGATSALSIIANDVLSVVTPQQLVSDFAPNFSTTTSSQTVAVEDSNIADVTTFDAVFFNTPISVGGVILHGIRPITDVTGTSIYELTAETAATGNVTSGGDVPEFTTTSGSANVVVSFPAHGREPGDVFTFPIETTVGGVTIVGTYTLQDSASHDADNFVISLDVLATSSATESMNGGDAQLVYYISLGPQAAGLGYGLGPYGSGGYGLGITPSAQVGDPIAPDNWSLDNWGETLVSVPENGGVYIWAPNRGYTTAQFVPTAPWFNNGAFIAMPQQILVCWGSTSGYPGQTIKDTSPEQRDPLVVRWSDIQDYTNFTPTARTQAGDFRLSSGSEIVAGMQGPQQALLWTDIDLWAMQYLGGKLVFGFNKIASGCGLIGRNAAGVMRGITAWMSRGSFFLLRGGAVEPLPCTVWDYIFQDLDTNNLSKITCAPNSQFSEFWWFFPSASGGTGEVDKYVKVNIDEGFAWDFGPLDRSAWIDRSVLGAPIGAAPNGAIYQHETGFDADTSPMMSYFETGWFAISEGSNVSFVDIFHPDMKWGTYGGAQTGNVVITIYTAMYPGETPRTYGPYTMTQASTFINTRCRGRLIKVRIASSDSGSFWRLGNVRIRVSQDGRR